MNPAEISVVIPAYNAESFIARAIQSVRAQTRPPREIIVVDDGSRDGTADAVRALGGDLVLVQQENKGPGAARNNGARHARSELVSFLDADDEYLPGAIATFERTMAEFPQAEVASGAILHVGAGRTVRTPAKDAIFGESRTAAVLPDFFAVARRHWPLVTADSAVVRRRALEAVGGFREDVRFGEDMDLWGRLAGRYPWAFVDEPVSVYYFSPANVQVSSSTARTPLAEQPTDLLMNEERMREWVRPELWESYRLYRRDLLCGWARGALALSEPRRGRRLLAGIPPAPVSPGWIATWLLTHMPLGRRTLEAYHAVRRVHGSGLPRGDDARPPP